MAIQSSRKLLMSNDWKSFDDSQGWKERAILVEKQENAVPSAFESGLRGAAQSATLGFADEIAGSGEALYDKLKGDPRAIMDLYRQHRDESRENFEKAKEANPASYFTGELIGSAPAALIPGSGIAKAVGLGGTMGLGMSNADLTEGELGRASLDTAVGGIAGAGAHKLAEFAAPKISAAINSGKQFAAKSAKKAISAALGPSEEAIEARLAGRAKDTAKSYSELAEEMKDSLARLGDQISDADQQAWDKLNPISDPNFGGYDKEVLTREIDDVRRSLSVNGKLIGNADNQAEGVLQKLAGDLDQFEDGVSQQDLKKIIQRLDDNINWDNPGASATNKALSKVRTSFKTALEDNQDYAEAMDPVSKKTALMNEVKRLFNFKNAPGEGLVPTDTTASKIKTSLNENKAITQDVLKALKEHTGDDFIQAAKDYELSREFQGGFANGSRRVNLGGMLGASLGYLGGPAGSIAGAGAGGMIGAHLDKEGGVYAGKLIDWYVREKPGVLVEQFGSHAKPLIEAAKRGPGALSVTNYIMQQTNPMYRSKLMQLSEQK